MYLIVKITKHRPKVLELSAACASIVFACPTMTSHRAQLNIDRTFVKYEYQKMFLIIATMSIFSKKYIHSNNVRLAVNLAHILFELSG